MAIPTVSLDENSPAGNTNMSLGDNRIREYKTQNREVMAVDHDYPSSGSSTTAGQHKKVTLQEQVDLGTGAVGAIIIGSQTISGRGELVCSNEDDVDIQLTSGAKVGSLTQNAVFNDVACNSITTTSTTNSPTGFVPIGGVVGWLKNLTATPSLPVNFVECNGQTLSDSSSVYNGIVLPDLNSTNRFLRGNSTSGTTGGASTVTLTTNELPAHSHNVTYRDNADGGLAEPAMTQANGTQTTFATASAGNGAAFSIIPPYYNLVWIMRIK